MSRDLNVDQIKKLWILHLVLEHGSLKKAALQAKVSPSAISQTITSLEQMVGRPLLIRDRASIEPTAEALNILEIVRPAFAAFEKLRDLNGAPVPKMSWINFGTYESIAIDLLPGLIQGLKQKIPNLRIGLRISRTANLLTMVRKGELCSALITEVDDLERFYIKPVTEDRLGFFASKKHPIFEKGWTAMEQYGYGSLAPGKEGLPRYFTKFMRQADLPKPTIISDSFEALRAAAVAGAIISILPHRVAKRDDNLVEIIRPHAGKVAKEVGRHQIYVVSPTNCDREEADFIAAEASRLLVQRN